MLAWNLWAKPDSRPYPAWLAERDANLRINELVRKSVVFLGILDDTGAFAPFGTGFVVLWPEADLLFSYLVTAEHVLDDMKKTKRPLVARLNTKAGGSQVGGIHGDKFWHTHPSIKKCDIAVTGFLASFDTFDVEGIPLSEQGRLTDEYVSENDVGCGDEVFTAGLLVNHFGTQRNIPVIRTGNIAAMPEEPVDLGDLGFQEVYLIESRSIGGLSGSPVFLHTPPFRIVHNSTKSMGGHGREYLMGVNIGVFHTKAHADTVSKDTAERREAFLETMSAGIAIVVPINRVVEIIEQTPVFVEERARAVEARKKKSGFVATSAKHPIAAVSVAENTAPPANDKNPTHRARFKALLNAAAKTPPDKN